MKSNANPRLLAMARDAVRFAQTFRAVIEIAPLQIYCSALIFSPMRSTVREQFWHNVPDWIEETPMVPEDWGSTLQVLDTHSGDVFDVRFSPDGKLLASGSDDKTVWLWDSATGTCRSTLVGHLSSVFSVAFSPDGKLLASGSYDKTVLLWDPATGTCRRTLEGHSSELTSVAFSPDGRLLRSTANDNVLFWGVDQGKVFQEAQASDAPCLPLLTGRGLDSTLGLVETSSGIQGGSQLAATSAFLLHVSKGWILLGERKLLFLPRDRGESVCFACSGSVVSIGYNTGIVSFVGFNVDSIP